MLLTLPPELLGRVVEFSMPDSFENLALSCHTMYEVAKPIIAAHNRLRSRWDHLALNSFKQPAATMMFLYAVAENPVTAEYVRSADFRGSFPLFNSAEPDAILRQEFSLLYDAASRKQLESFITDSRLLFPRNADWAACVDQVQYEMYLEDERHVHVSDDEDDDGEDNDDEFSAVYPPANWTTAFLLTLLTNVRVLSVGSEWQYMDPEETNVTGPWNLLERIARLSHERRTASPELPLSKLTELRALAPARLYPNFTLQSLFPLLGLASLERLYANGCTVATDSDYHLPVQWPYPDLTSNLRTIEFLECCIDDKTLSSLLARTPNLVSFKYSHQAWYRNRFQSILHHWDAAAFVATISKHCGRQLTTLAITVHRMSGSIITGVVSMKGFTRLESAELDVSIFAGPSPESGERFGEQCCGPREFYPSWTPDLVPKLTEILPPSLKRLRLFNRNHRQTDAHVACALLRDFAAGRDWLLSDLEDIIFCHRIEQDPESTVCRERRQRIMDSAKAAGIEFRASLTMFPQWHHEFARKCSILGDGGELPY